MSATQELIKTDAIAPFAEIQKLGHENIVYCYDKETGLKAIIGIHNTVLGPALGGTRMWMYENEAQALNDVLRLSRGMTYKAAISGLNLGGGKAVIIGDAKKDKSEALFRRFGRFVESLNGKYITAEDVGIGTKDIEYMAMETKHVSGKPENMGGSGDPSPVTAYGVYLGMKASAKKAYGNDSLAGKKIALQGVGHVGEYLLERLVKEGAKVTISDYYADRVKEVTAKYAGVTGVGLDEIYDVDMDIYAPCALGATVNDNTLSRLKCQIISGAANNQLADEEIHGNMCVQKGIIYAPDFLINAGGLINVCSELTGYNREKAFSQAENIYNTTTSIFEYAEKEKIHTQKAAMLLAEKRIEDMKNVHSRR
jgi:leucine dehydrogenase